MLKNLSRIVLIALLLNHQHFYSQTISGIITDAETGEKLPYVHIGIKNTNKGTISKDDGSFSISLDGINTKKRLFFSILGYEELFITLDEIEGSPFNVHLKPTSISLSEVILDSKKKKYKKIKLGNYKNSTTTTGKSGDEVFGWGGEWGIILPKYSQEYKIKDVQFHLRFNTVDSILFRVNIYKVKSDKQKFESILQKPAFVTSKKNDNWITLNMMDRDIWVDDKILVTIEWVRIWYAGEGQNLIFFTHAKDNKFRVIHKNNSYGTWQVNKRPALAIYINGLAEK